MGRLVRLLGRIKASFLNFAETNSPMPNPPHYKPPVVTLKNLSKLPWSVHRQVWSSSWKEYRDSFDDSFAWSKNRTKVNEEGSEEILDKRKMLEKLVKDVREHTKKTPEDIAEAKKAIRELMDELHNSQDGIKAAAKEKMELIKLSLAEFSAGYRETRDMEIKRVMSMDQSVFQDFLKERASELQHATTVIASTIIDDPKKKASDREGDEEEEKESESSEKDQGLKSFLSPRAREAVDSVLQDPDVQQLGGRLKGFARERVLAAEAAARIIKGEDEEKTGAGKGDGTSPGTGTGGAVEEGKGDTPILSGLAKDTRGFVEGRMGELKGGVQELWKEASELIEERRKEAGDAGRSEGTNELATGEVSTTEQERRDKGDQHGVDRAEGGRVVREDEVDLSRPTK